MTEQKSAPPSESLANLGVSAKTATTISAAEVSALMDNELTRRECDAAVGALAHEESLRATWQRYHLMRTALRHEPHYPVAADLADRIAARLDTDATPVYAARGLMGLRWPSRARRGAAYAAAYKGAAGLALAASVAAVAIVGVRTLTPAIAPGVAVPPQAALAPAPTVGTAPVSVAAAPQPSRRGIHWDTAQPEVENNLNAFLVQHSEFTRTSGMGVMSYVRIAGYDTHDSDSKE